MIAFDIRHYDRLDSTQDEARRLAQAGAAHGMVVVADEQTAGRGRLGRSWMSPPGNVYLSVLLRPDLPPPRIVELGFVAALAVADTVDTFLPGRSTLKWPNDVLVDGGKISGILIEQVKDAAIAGIGLNVRSPAPCNTVMGGEGSRPYAIASLVHAGARDATVAAVRTAILAAFADRWDAWRSDGFVAIREAWLARARPPGTTLRVMSAGSATIGRFVGVAADGALLLDTEGRTVRFVAGDVVLT